MIPKSRIPETIGAVLALSVASAFFATFVTHQPPLTFAEIAFGFFPTLAFAAALCTALLRFVGNEPVRHATRYAIRLVAVTSFVAIIASWTRLWNDGRYEAILAPRDALLSIATFGIIPFKLGPSVFIRFLPLIFGLGVALRLWRDTENARVSILRACACYLLLAGLIHTMTWVGLIFSWRYAETIASASDVVRLLTRAQADGYWTHAQSNRFFMPLGQQSENSFAGIQTAITFIFSATVFLFWITRQITPMSLLRARMPSRSVAMLVIASAGGFVLGLLIHGPVFSYTDGLSYIVFGSVLCAWIAWWRLAPLIVSFPREEPSDESVRDVLLLLALAGSFVLGWPVFLPMISTTIVVWIREHLVRDTLPEHARQILFRRDDILNFAARMLIAGSIGSAALATALRDVAEPAWMLRIVFAVAFLIGFEHFFRSLDRATLSRGRELLFLCCGIGGALLLARQPVFWLLFLPSLAIALLVSRGESSWARFRLLPADLAIGGMTGILFFFSHTLASG